MSHPDDLQLAAFVEGHLSAGDRDRIIVHLADCPTCAELIGETQRFLGEAEAGAARPHPHRPLSQRPQRVSRSAVRWFLGAAIAATIALAVPGLWRAGAPATAGLSAELAGQIEPKLSDSLSDRIWSQPAPGFAFAAPLTAEQADFRWGVASIDLELAAARGDRRAIAAVHAGLESWQPSAPGFAAGKAVIAALAHDDSSRWLGQLRRLESQLQETGEPSAFALGRWVEAGRLAALSGDEPLLRSILASSRRPEVVDSSISLSVAEIDALTPAGASAWDLPTLAIKFRDVILLY